MRTFYIFKISKEFKIITENSPYNLFLALDNIYKMDKHNVRVAYYLFDQICDVRNNEYLSRTIYNDLKDTDYYMKYANKHIINNFYTNESSRLTVNTSYIKLKTTSYYSTFFKILKTQPNLFVVDFNAKDYFWLS